MRFPVFMVCCLMVCMLVCGASAETRIMFPEISLEDTADLPVTISGIAAATGISFELSYDREVIHIEDITANSEIPGSSMVVRIDNDIGHVKVVIVNTEGISAVEPTLLTIIRLTRVGSGGSTVVIQDPRWSDTQLVTNSFDVVLNGNIKAMAPAANFTANTTSGPAPLTVWFTDLSTGNPTGWFWSFGDGATSTKQNPTHTYTAPGNYTVNLTVSSEAGSDTLSRPDYITVTRVKGDFNGNGEVDIGDVSKVAYMVVEKEPADLAADFNGNDRIDIGDAAKIAYYFVGKIGEL